MGVNWVEVFSVVVTGLVVVFLALVILIFAVKLSSVLVRKVETFFSGKNKTNATKHQALKKEEVSKEEVSLGKEEKPTIEDGIDEETVAAITAAIKMMADSDGVTYKISGIKRKKTPGMSIWGKTGILENTRAF